MNLLEYQRHCVEVFFAARPSDAQLAALGQDAGRWRVYRRMVRSRLWSMAKVAFERTHALAPEALLASHDRFLAAHGPRSRFIREVVADFGSFALDDEAWGPPPALRDLLRFERCKWQLAYLSRGDVPAVRELDFDGEPLLEPAFRVEHFAHAVQAGARDAWPAAADTNLFIYRPAGQTGVRWWSVDPFAAALFERLQAGGAPLADAVRAAAAQVELPVDQALLERLSSLLALAVERGVLLGTLDA